MINRTSLAEALRAIGRAFVYAGDPTTAGGLTPLGQTEGDISVQEEETTNDFTVPELTGDAVHERSVMQAGAVVTVPLIIGPAVDGSDDGSAVYDLISSVGDGAGGGYSEQQPAVTTTILIIPASEVPAAGLSFAAAAWTGGAPVHAVWLWRAVAEASEMTFRHGDGGKVIREVPFRTLFDATKPEGHKLWTRGDPDAAGIAIEI